MHEWEYAALALPIGASDSAALTQINNDWYSRKTPKQAEVGSIYENKYGIWDMYGLVWEWVYDFNSVVSNEDSRNSEDVIAGLFFVVALRSMPAMPVITWLLFAIPTVAV